MKFYEFFLTFYSCVFLASWTVFGLYPNDAYLYVATIVTITLIGAIIGFFLERKYPPSLYWSKKYELS